MNNGKHYDVGIVGWWYNLNYGGTLTYYALNQAVQGLGKSVLMIQRSGPADKQPDLNAVPRRFAAKHYDISERYTYSRMKELNDICDAFIAGSDQLWNPWLIPYAGPEFFLSFAQANHTKLAYATSFGNIEHCNADFIAKYGPFLKNFDGISVREDYAVDICKSDFDIDAVQMCDPVFLCGKEKYSKIADASSKQYPGKYVMNFLLDPNKEKVEACRHIRKSLGIEERVNFTDLQKTDLHVSNFDGEPVEAGADIEDFVKAYRDAEFIVTDSFHGTCLAIIFNKPFISLANKTRGEKRFVSLLKWAKLTHRLVFNIQDVYNNRELLKPVDFAETNKIIASSRKIGLNWLKSHLNMSTKEKLAKKLANMKKLWQRSGSVFSATPTAAPAPGVQKNTAAPVKPTPAAPADPAVAALHSNPDFIKIRILATLLRDYGVKHIVLSPGGRDVPLVRMFEYNEEHFVLHRVTDERSAAYYGMGIAMQLQQPVACVCTSGTAASNYLPAVTEAYYTGVPLIMVTADRREVYLNHGEDQTIPQKNIYRDVVKKEVSLPEGGGYQAEYQTRRDISDCILETTHNGLGPVHINISIENIGIGSKVSREHWKLLPRINPHILRVSANDDDAEMMKWVQALRNSKKILVVYGQNAKPTERQLKNIERFAAKYNCVIVTDFISNLDCAYSLKPYNMLNGVSQAEFNEKLSPDILISVGGKRLMNDPLTFKVRGGLKNIRHWSVTPDGKVKDYYFRLSSVIETTQDYFFEWFADHAGDVYNDGAYFGEWKNMTEKYNAPTTDKYNAHFIQRHFIPAVPANSMLHLGVGQSFYDCRRYTMNPNVEVHCNMGTNGIDGCTSTFMGQCAVASENKLCFLLVGDLSFFYDMNSIWNKPLNKNIRILMVNNNGTGLLRGHNLKGVSSVHNTEARKWVESTGFDYISARNKDEYLKNLKYFLSDKPQKALFFEVFCD